MKVKTTFLLKDGRTAVVLKDAYDPDFAIVSGYNPDAPEGQQWDGGIYFYGNKALFFNAVLDIETSAASKEKFDVALIEKPLEEGLDRREVNELIGMLDESCFETINLDADYHESAAMGFATESAMDELGHCLDGLQTFLARIMDDMAEESEDHIYEYEGLKIYLGR